MGLFLSFRLHGVLDKLRSVTTGKAHKSHVWVFLEFAVMWLFFKSYLYCFGKKIHEFENSSSIKLFKEAHVFMNLRAINLI